MSQNSPTRTLWRLRIQLWEGEGADSLGKQTLIHRVTLKGHRKDMCDIRSLHGFTTHGMRVRSRYHPFQIFSPPQSGHSWSWQTQVDKTLGKWYPLGFVGNWMGAQEGSSQFHSCICETSEIAAVPSDQGPCILLNSVSPLSASSSTDE